MSRHRVKAVAYDEDDFDDGYDSPDPEEQEFLEQCTAEVLSQLLAGSPSVTATRDEVQEALWHYYNDVEKSVNYLRNKKAKETKKKESAPAPAAKAKVPAYPLPPDLVLQEPPHFSAADFFRDSPWLNVPAHRKADILIEPLYPRLGLLGGAPESGGKVSKLAALAAARKKKEGDKASTAAPAQNAEVNKTPVPSTEQKGASLSLRERLAGNGKIPKPEGAQSPRPLGKLSHPGSHSPQKKPSPELVKQNGASQVNSANVQQELTAGPLVKKEEKEQPTVNIRASPSTFASTIVGDVTRPKLTEPSPLFSTSLDLMEIYGQNLTEPFDFTGPSPDDVVLNAQSSAKGLAIRRKI